MTRLFFLTAVLVPCLALSACSALGGHREKHSEDSASAKKHPAAAPLIQVVGTIALVNAPGAYVLVDCGGFGIPASGTLLSGAAGEGEPWEARVSAIQKRPFVVADVLKGTPLKGARALREPAATDQLPAGTAASALDQ